MEDLRKHEDLKEAKNADNKKKTLKERYTNIIWELNELTNTETEDDNVDIVNKDLNNAFKNFLEENPDKLDELRQMVANLWETWKETRWKGFDILVKFLKKIEKKEWKREKSVNDDKTTNESGNSNENRTEKKSENDYKEFLKKLKDPNKLSSMNNREIGRVKQYLQSNKAASIKAYTEMKNVDWGTKSNEKDKAVFNEIWDALKEKYQNDSAFLEEDFKDLNNSVDVLKKYAGNDWNGENLSTEATLQSFDPNKTIISKDYFIQEFNTYNEQRINKIKTSTINWCYEALISKYDFQKTDNELQFKSKNSETWLIAGSDTVKEDFAEDIKAFIWNQGNLVDNEPDRLLNNWSSEIYQALLGKTEIEVSKDSQDKKVVLSEIGVIGEDERAMDERDFESMQNWLKDDMFIKKKSEGNNNITYSYDLGKVKKYLLYSANNDNETFFKLSTTSGVSRRTWISAIQILLNSKASDGWKNIKVDWKFWINGDYYAGETHDAVLKFQKEYNESHPDATIAEDWVPGPITIAALLEK